MKIRRIAATAGAMAATAAVLLVGQSFAASSTPPAEKVTVGLSTGQSVQLNVTCSGGTLTPNHSTFPQTDTCTAPTTPPTTTPPTTTPPTTVPPTTVPPTTTPPTTTPPAGGTCTSPVWSTSDAEGTDNLDPYPAPEYWWMDNDAWSGSHGPQTLYVCNQSSWYAVSNQTDNGGQVETYPNTEYDVGGRASPSTKTIAGYNSITSTFSENYPAAGSWDASYDLWTNNWANETMIWNQDLGDPTYWNTQGTAVTIAGVQYEFVNFGTSAPDSGELVFIMKNQEQSGSVNILAVYQWEVANGYAKATDVPTQLEYGVEIEATPGNETFPMNGLTFDLS